MYLHFCPVILCHFLDIWQLAAVLGNTFMIYTKKLVTLLLIAVFLFQCCLSIVVCNHLYVDAAMVTIRYMDCAEVCGPGAYL